MEDNVSISFDEENKIRTLPTDKYRETELMVSQCKDFVEKMGLFKNTVQGLVDVLTAQAQQIEKEKLRAIGQRLQVEMEADNRRKRQHELEMLIREKTAEIERLNFQYNSLERVEKEQRILIEKLNNNEA
jgi:intraflagellar transport protein 20